jgi:hypothetical protein
MSAVHTLWGARLVCCWQILPSFSHDNAMQCRYCSTS